MAFVTLGDGANRPALSLGCAALLLVLWSGCTAAAVPMQTEGALSVGPDGTADYTLQIAVPPGTAGTAPALSLGYSSGGADGILGVGWSLGGLPSITRCAQTVAQDGKSVGVTFTGTDRFCLGGQRLVMISDSSYYGADGAEYRTEIDSFSKIISHGGSQAGGPQYFEVFTKSGQIQEFGNTADSFVQAAGLTYTAARAWALDKVSDHSGNYYTVSYSPEDSTTGETHPLEIDYTGNTNGLTPYNSVKLVYGPPPGASGAAATNSRQHPLIAHLAGTTATTSVLLTNIQSFAGPTLVHDYRLTYQTGGTGRPQLVGLDHCDGGGNCLPATSFNWSNTSFGATTVTEPSCAVDSPLGASSGGLKGAQAANVDLNSDGRDDLLWTSFGQDPVTLPNGAYQIWYSNGDGSFECVTPSFSNASSPFTAIPFFGDFGGTGRTDVLLQGETTDAAGRAVATGSWQLWVNNGGETGSFTQVDSGFSGKAASNQLAIADFEGKGRTSIVLFNTLNGANDWEVWTNSGNYALTKIPASSNGLSGFGAGYAVYPGDFDGDGKVDLLFVKLDPQTGQSSGLDYQIAYSNGDGTFTAKKITLPVPAGPFFFTIGDFNGDGVADLILNAVLFNGADLPGLGEIPFGTGHITVLMGRGDGTFDPPVPFTLPNFYHIDGPAPQGPSYVALIANLSGNGRSDLILDGETTILGLSVGQQYVYTSNGDGSFSPAANYPAPPFPPTSLTLAHLLLSDFRGVGHDSMLWDEIGNVSVASMTNQVTPQSDGTDHFYLTDPTQPDLITTMTSGLGATATITYSPLSQGGFYAPDPVGTTSNPTISLQTAQPAVSSLETSDGIGGTRTVNFGYSGLRADMQGRGILGFSGMIATDESTGITTATSYNQAFPEIGRPGAVVRSIATGPAAMVTLSSTTFNYDVVTEFPGTMMTTTTPGTPSVSFVGPSAMTVTPKDLDETPLPIATMAMGYDCDFAPQSCFGNMMTQVVTLDSTVTAQNTVMLFNYFPADTANWLIAEIANMTMTDSVPGQTAVTRTNDFTYFPDTGLLASSTVEPGQSSTNAAGEVSQLQLTTTYAYDGFGNPTLTDVMPSDGAAARPTTMGWATSSPDLNTAAQFDQFPQTMTNALDQSVHLGYDVRFGTPSTAKDLNNLATTTSYDGFGRPLLMLGPDGTGMQLVYAYCSTLASLPANAPVEQNCPALGRYAMTMTPVDSTGTTIGPVVAAIFDVLGRKIQTDMTAFDGQGTSRVQTDYNALGQVTLVSQPVLVSGAPSCSGGTAPSCTVSAPTPVSPGNTSFLYDLLGRVVKMTPPDGGVVMHGYSGLVQTDTLPIATGPFAGTETIVTTRNALGQIVTVRDPIGNVTTSTYAPFGNLASVTDQAGNVVSYTYDALGRRNGIIDPDAGPRSMSYFSTGEMRSLTAPGATSAAPAVTANFLYDQLGRLTSRSEPDLSSFWSYDENGHLGKLTTAGTTPIAGGDAGYPGGCVYGYGYDAFQRPSGTTLVFGGTTVFGFADAYVPLGQPGAGQLAGVTDNNSGSVTRYAYSAVGYFQQLSRGTIGASATNPVYTVATEDASLRPMRVTLGTAGFHNNMTAATSVTDLYTYDQLNQLRQAVNGAGTKSFDYDGQTGNLINKSDTGVYSYGPPGGTGPHQLQAIAPPTGGSAPVPSEPITASYSYDARGNMIAGEDTASYSWSSFDQPLTIAKGGAGVKYYYDMNHNRIGVTTTVSGTAATKLYLRDVSGAFAEGKLDQSGNVTAVLDYFSARGTDVGMLMTPVSSNVPGTGSMVYFHTDLRGSITALSDDTGLTAEFDAYDPWGKARQLGGGDDAGNVGSSLVSYGYIDEEKIAGVSDLINLNARLYNPHTGRFISADPIGLKGGSNVYAYSVNNPTTRSDRSGLDSFAPDGNPAPGGIISAFTGGADFDSKFGRNTMTDVIFGTSSINSLPTPQVPPSNNSQDASVNVTPGANDSPNASKAGLSEAASNITTGPQTAPSVDSGGGATSSSPNSGVGGNGGGGFTTTVTYDGNTTTVHATYQPATDLITPGGSGYPFSLNDNDGLYRLIQGAFLTARPVGSALTKIPTDPSVAIAASPLIRAQAVKNGTYFIIASTSYYGISLLLQADTTINPDTTPGIGTPGAPSITKQGVVEYIVPVNNDFFLGDPILTHQRFVPGAGITGVPNNFGGIIPPLGVY